MGVSINGVVPALPMFGVLPGGPQGRQEVIYINDTAVSQNITVRLRIFRLGTPGSVDFRIYEGNSQTATVGVPNAPTGVRVIQVRIPTQAGFWIDATNCFRALWSIVSIDPS